MTAFAPEPNPQSAATSPTHVAEGLGFSDESNINDMNLTFGLADEEYGICIAHVTEIVGMQRIMEVPDVPHFIKGVINLRGKIIPVMDVRARFKMAETAYTERTVIIVLDMQTLPIGLIVDNVNEVLEIPPANIDPAPAFDGGRQSEGLLRGLGKSGDRVAILLDLERMVASDLAEIQRQRTRRSSMTA